MLHCSARTRLWKVLDLRKVAGEHVRARLDREVTETTECTALAKGGIAAGQRDAELRRHVLEDVDRHLAGVLSNPVRIEAAGARWTGIGLRTRARSHGNQSDNQ